MSEKKTLPLPRLTPQQKKRMATIRARLKNQPPLEEILTETELIEGIPHDDYFSLRDWFVAFRKERKRQGLTLAQVAEKAEITTETLSRLESGSQINPTYRTLCLLIRALGRRVVLDSVKVD